MALQPLQHLRHVDTMKSMKSRFFPHFNDNRPYLLSVALPADLLQSRQPFQYGLIDGFRPDLDAVLDAVASRRNLAQTSVFSNGNSNRRERELYSTSDSTNPKTARPSPGRRIRSSPLANSRTYLIALFMSLNQCEPNDGEFALWANQRPRLLLPNAVC